MLARSYALSLLALSFAAACSSSSTNAGSGASAAIPAAYAGYCAGTLTKEAKVMRAANTLAGAWIGSGERVGAGSPVIVGVSFDRYEAFVFMVDGTPAKVLVELGKGVTKDTDFKADCAPSTPPSSSDKKTAYVTLGDATLYPNKDLSGTACTLPGGTILTNHSFIGGEVGEIGAPEIDAKCGFAKGYTKDFHAEDLLTK